MLMILQKNFHLILKDGLGEKLVKYQAIILAKFRH